MTKENAVKNNLYKPCTSCGQSVHSRSNSCKACGAPSPWLEKRGDTAVKNIIPKIESPKTDASEPQKAYIVMKDFSTMVGNVMVNLKAKRVITDQNLIKSLLDAGSPIMEVGTTDDVCVCPACKHIFTNGKSGSGAAR